MKTLVLGLYTQGILGLIIVVFSTTVSSLYCYSCSHNKVTSDTTGIGQIFDALSSISDKSCLFKEESDKNEAHQRSCPEPESGKEAKCVVFNGTATADIEIAGVSITTIKYHSVVRDCIEVDPDDDAYSDGCHDDVPSTALGVFDSAFNTLSLGDVQFQGKVCYSRDKDEFQNTSGTSQVVPLMLWVGLICVTVLYFLIL